MYELRRELENLFIKILFALARNKYFSLIKYYQHLVILVPIRK